MRAEIYKRYPVSSFLIYNGSTMLHFLLGGIGIILGYGFHAWIGFLLGVAYFIFAFGEMYVVMPLTVCPSCVYFRLQDGFCVSGLNILSRKVAQAAGPELFSKRAEGLLCSNNLYMAALLFPILAIIPALVFNFSNLLLLLELLLAGLTLFRFFVIFPRIACLHCAAKFNCPQAGQMGLRDL